MKSLLEHLEGKFTVGDGCWEWTGDCNTKGGYGRIYLDGRYRSAHRVVYELLVAPIPDGFFIDHKCRQHACVNPAHLRVVDPRTNSLENSVGVGALNAGKTHCSQGHPYDEANTYRSGDGRRCRLCDTMRKRRVTNRAEQKPER